MARDKKPADPPGDIPAWFMTYSDVITLLMTFFILLLTFATTQPERFEKSASSTFASGSATGVAGEKLPTDNDSWVSRVRKPSARLSMRGAEMPSITKQATKAAFGEGLRSLNEEEKKHNEHTTHSFELPFVQMFNREGLLTDQGADICKALADQLEALPFQASIQFADETHTKPISGMMEHFFHFEKTRPGQLSMSFTKHGLNKENIRVLVRHFSPNKR